MADQFQMSRLGGIGRFGGMDRFGSADLGVGQRYGMQSRYAQPLSSGLRGYTPYSGNPEDLMEQSKMNMASAQQQMKTMEELEKEKLNPQNYMTNVRSSGGNIRASIRPSDNWYRSIERLPFPPMQSFGGGMQRM